MSTELRSPRYVDLDLWPTLEAAEAMLEGQMAAIAAVRPALPELARAADAAAARLGDSGRLVYVGAGTSGRIAVQDGVELGPTYDWPESRLVYAIAGGTAALTGPVEDAEDDHAAGCAAMVAAKLGAADIVIGVAASGNTPFTVGAVETANAAGALTIGCASNAGSKLMQVSRHPLLVETGAEPVTGSTRMKAGTAQKAVLNILSTAIMLRMGRVYQGLMVNMRPTNIKLQLRAVRMVQQITDCSETDARMALAGAQGNIKCASLMLLASLSLVAAQEALHKAGDNLRIALAGVGQKQS
jgi:N-acetylmuramic acid 6-phosphate etherase